MEVVITEPVVAGLQEKFLEFIVEYFGDVSSYCFDSEGVKLIFKSVTSAEKCLATKIVYNCKLINATKLIKDHQFDANMIVSFKEAFSKTSDFERTFEDELNALIAQIEESPFNIETLDELVSHLQSVLEAELPGCHVTLFGSITTGLVLESSDVDLFVYLDEGRIEHIRGKRTEHDFHTHIIKIIKQKFYRNGDQFTHIVPIPKAKVPIIKFTHIPSGYKCDLSFKGGFGVFNSLLLREILATDDRIRPMLMFLKYWTKTLGIVKDGSFSSYAIIMLAIYYMQNISPPMLPTIESLQKGDGFEAYQMNNWKCNFNLGILSSFKNENRDSIIKLLDGFFQMCSEFEFKHYVITTYTGEKYNKILFRKVDDFPAPFRNYANLVVAGQEMVQGKAEICILDPFVHSRNLTSPVSSANLHYFKMNCKLAVDNIRESTGENLIKKLLEQKVTLPRFHKGIRLPKDIKTELKNGNLCFVEELKSHIENILTNCLRCDFEMAESTDVKKSVYSLVYKCAVFYNTWTNRKKYSTNDVEDIMTREKIITETIIQNDYENVKPEKSIFDCSITFNLKKTKIGFVIEYVKYCDEFRNFYQCLDEKLYVLLPYLIEHEMENCDPLGAAPISINLPVDKKMKFTNNRKELVIELMLLIQNIINNCLSCDFEVVDEYWDSERCEYFFTYNCTIFYNTWTKRKGYPVNEIVDVITREKTITDTIIKNHYGNIKPDEPMLECSIIFKLNNTSLDFFNECENLNDAFYEFDQYVNSTLQRLLTNLIKAKESKVSKPSKLFAPRRLKANRIRLPQDIRKQLQIGNMIFVKKLKSDIKKVLTHYLRCDFKIVDNNNKPTRKALRSFMYVCTLFYNTWENRVAYSENEVEDEIDREKIITDMLIKNEYKDIKPENRLLVCNMTFTVRKLWIEFSCEFNPIDNALDESYLDIELKMKDLLSSLITTPKENINNLSHTPRQDLKPSLITTPKENINNLSHTPRQDLKPSLAKQEKNTNNISNSVPNYPQDEVIITSLLPNSEMIKFESNMESYAAKFKKCIQEMFYDYLECDFEVVIEFNNNQNRSYNFTYNCDIFYETWIDRKLYSANETNERVITDTLIRNNYSFKPKDPLFKCDIEFKIGESLIEFCVQSANFDQKFIKFRDFMNGKLFLLIQKFIDSQKESTTTPDRIFLNSHEELTDSD